MTIWSDWPQETKEEFLSILREEFKNHLISHVVERLVKMAIENELKPGGILYDR